MASYRSTNPSFSSILMKSFFGGCGISVSHDCFESSSVPKPAYGAISCGEPLKSCIICSHYHWISLNLYTNELWQFCSKIRTISKENQRKGTTYPSRRQYEITTFHVLPLTFKRSTTWGNPSFGHNKMSGYWVVSSWRYYRFAWFINIWHHSLQPPHLTASHL